MGKGIAGKSKLTYAFIDYEAPSGHDPTIEDRYKACYNYDGKDYEIDILDTAGEEDYENMLDMWISISDGFLLVFTIDNRESFEYLKIKRELVLESKKKNKFPMILVGNNQELENERKVSYKEAKDLANSWGIEYLEASAKTKYNIKEVFEKLFQKIAKNLAIIGKNQLTKFDDHGII